MSTQSHTVGVPTAPPTTGKRLAARFGPEDEGGWERHANPASVWTRFAALPMLAASIWSRDWIGAWCLVPSSLSLVWMAVNPLFFGPPDSTRNWASKAVFGERIFVHRDQVQLPPQFRSRVPQLIQVFQALGLVPLAYGLVALDPVATATGVAIVQRAALVPRPDGAALRGHEVTSPRVRGVGTGGSA